LKSGHPHDRHATAYYGIAPSVFQAMVRKWRKSRPQSPIEDFSFVDIGAGMGRAVLLAAQLPFREASGVELNPALVRIARRNLAVWRSSGRAQAPMKMICGDAAEFALPAGPCLAFLFNPFGAPVMRRLLAAWSKSLAGRSGQLDILYINNEQDAVADHRILFNQPEGEYAYSIFEDCSIWRWQG
jgi:SAM-dependent methyltransferase